MCSLVEVLYPVVMGCFTGKKDESAGANADVNKPDFELSEEYIEICYRQFIMYMGLSVFPMITAITLGANILEIFVDRYRLIKMCAKPKGTIPSSRRKLVVQLIFAAFFGLIAFPCGPIWFIPVAGAGPFLQWPCPQYSASTIFSENATLGTLNSASSFQVCPKSASFEEPNCKLANGQDVSVAVIRMHTNRLKGWETLQNRRASEAADYSTLL
jgi:hypothetical protein